MDDQELENRLTRLETKVEYLCRMLNDIRDNEQRHVWALILMLCGTLVPLILKVLNII